MEENIRGERGLERSGSAALGLVAKFIRCFQESIPLFACKKILQQAFFLCVCNKRYSDDNVHFIDNINLGISEINEVSHAANRTKIIWSSWFSAQSSSGMWQPQESTSAIKFHDVKLMGIYPLLL